MGFFKVNGLEFQLLKSVYLENAGQAVTGGVIYGEWVYITKDGDIIDVLVSVVLKGTGIESYIVNFKHGSNVTEIPDELNSFMVKGSLAIELRRRHG